MARCTIAAATAESTPPESAQIARPSPICARMLLDLLVDDVDHRPGRAAAGDVVQEVLEHLLAVLGVQHLGVPLHAGEPRSVSSNAATGVTRVEASTSKPGGAAITESPWDIQTVWSAGRSASRVPPRSTLTGVRPYSRAPVGETAPPRPWAISWKP